MNFFAYRMVVFALMLFTLCSFSSAQEESIILGVLEDTPRNDADAPNYRSARVLFFRVADGWKAFPARCADYNCLRSANSALSRDMNWKIGFDGRSLGELTSQLGDKQESSFLPGQFRLSSSPIPTVGKPSQEYAGWLGSPVNRPLVLNSRPNFSDTERWKQATLPDIVLAKVRKEFRKRYTKLTNCEDDKAHDYANTDIRVVKSYASKGNWRLIQAAVKGCATDDERGDPLDKEWFVVGPDGTVSYLDSNMHLVDTGDYDNDGKSELVFSIDDYNRGGYKLFYDEFRRRTIFEFSYH